MQLDWASEWHKRRQEYFWTKRLQEKGMSNEDYWNNYPDGLYAEHHKYTGYPGAILEKMKPFLHPQARVLDIGAATARIQPPWPE